MIYLPNHKIHKTDLGVDMGSDRLSNIVLFYVVHPMAQCHEPSPI